MKKGQAIIVTLFVFMSLALSAKVFQAAEPPILAALVGKEKERVASLIEKAKKEGELNYTTNWFQSFTEKALHAKFKQLYGLKDLKVNHFLLKSAELVSRVDQEVKAGKVMLDWIMVNVPGFFNELNRRGAFLKYCCPEYRYYETFRKQAMLPTVPCYYQNITVISFTGLWNPEYIKEDITSWWDFTNPKYKGKMIVANARKAPVYLDTYIVLRQILGTDFFEKLAKLNPFFLVRSTEIRDKVMTGEYPIAFMGLHFRGYQVRHDVDIRTVFPEEGCVFEPNMTAILKEAKHPNAAKLWTDFIYGETAQNILVEKEAPLTCRDNMKIPPEVAKFSPPLSEIKPIPFDWTKLTEETRTKYRNEFIQIFGK